MRYTEAENIILNVSRGLAPREALVEIESSLLNRKREIDYIMDRFIEQFGTKLDEYRDDNYNRFYKRFSEEYAKITRLQRVMKAFT